MTTEYFAQRLPMFMDASLLRLYHKLSQSGQQNITVHAEGFNVGVCCSLKSINRCGSCGKKLFDMPNYKGDISVWSKRRESVASKRYNKLYKYGCSIWSGI